MMWKEKYKIGVPLIDQQHEELFARVTTFIQTFRGDGSWEEKVNKVIETMKFMQEYVIVHFHDEEHYQEQINYPLMESHKEEHNRFKQNVNEYVVRIKNENFSEELVQEFGGKLMAWLIMHVAGTDQKIGEYVESLVKSDFVDPFYDATKEVYKIMLDLQTEKDKLSVVNHISRETATSVTVTLGIIGDLEGTIVFNYPVELTLKMVKIMAGMDVHEVDLFVSSALGEIANIIAGSAVTKLAANNIICDIVPPKVTVGDEPSCMEETKSFVLMPVATPIGNFDIHLLLHQNATI